MSSPANPLFDPEPLPSDLQTPPLPSPLPVPAERPPKADENPVWSGWDVLQLTGFSILTLLVVQLLIVLAARQFVFRHANWLEVAGKPVLALMAQLITYAVVALYMFLLVEGKYHVRFGKAIRWNWPGASGVNFLGIGALMISFSLLSRFLPMPKTTPFDQFFETPADAYLLAFFAISVGPLMEELFFRGFLYPVLARRLGVLPAILITAIFFGGIHSPQYGYSWAVLIIFLVGVVLTTVRAVTKSVACGFLAHVGYNAMLMLLAAIATSGFRHMDKAATFLFW